MVGTTVSRACHYASTIASNLTLVTHKKSMPEPESRRQAGVPTDFLRFARLGTGS